MPRGIADERDSADRTVMPTGNKTKMWLCGDQSTLLIRSAPKQKSNEWMHLSSFYTRMHGEWLRYAKSTSQFHWRFLLVRDVRGFQVNPLCRHDITRSDRQIGNHGSPSGERDTASPSEEEVDVFSRYPLYCGRPSSDIVRLSPANRWCFYMYASDTSYADGVPHSDPLGDAVRSSHEGELGNYSTMFWT